MKGTLVYHAIDSEKPDQALQKIIQSTDYPVNQDVYANACIIRNLTNALSDLNCLK